MGLKITRTCCPACDSATIGKVLTCRDHTVSNELFEIWQCDACTFRFTQNVPDQNGIGPYYKSDTYISHSDTGQGFINKLYKLARNYTLRWKMKVVNRFTRNGPETGSLLDIGAGTGAFLNRVIAENWSVTGVEPDEGARNISKEKYQLELESPEILFELPSQKFDAVTLWHVLEHVHQLHEYIDQVKRVMKRDGVALVALPNYTSKDAQYYKENWAAYDVPRHLYHFSPMSFVKLFEKHDMKVESVKPMWLDAFYISMLSEKYKSGKSNLAGAVLSGLKSNWSALRTKEQCSSLLYVIRNKE